jgi:tRNA threonylcarbamoyladenosine biosynthesis protein TsaB
MLLAVDTSTAQVGLALFDGAQVDAELMWHSRQHHTVELAPALAELLARTGIKMTDVQALGVAIGPGSFTSLRVGLSFIKGLSLVRRLPVIGIRTLDVIAAAQPISKLPLATVLQAGRGRLALGWYQSSDDEWKSDGEVKVTNVDELADMIEHPTIVAGELNAEERQRLARKKVNVQLATPSACVRRPAILAELAFARWQAGQVDEAASLAPIYLHVGEGIPDGK